MSGWRHVDDCGTPDDDPFCGCTTPTPDRYSECGFDGCWMMGFLCHCDDPSEDCKGDHPISADGGHPYIPTRCTCGHPIEAVP